LTHKHIEALQGAEYEYIIGARLKNESEAIKGQVIQREYLDGTVHIMHQNDSQRLIVQYKELKRVLKDEKTSMSLKTASEITHNMYKVTCQLLDSKHIKSTDVFHACIIFCESFYDAKIK